MRQAARRTLPAGLVGAALIGVSALVASAAAAPPEERPGAGVPTPVPADHRALLDRYCVTCHNDRLQTGGLSFEADGFHDVGRDTEAWERVIRKLRSATMPPAGRPRPEPARYASFAAGWKPPSIAPPPPTRVPAVRRRAVSTGPSTRTRSGICWGWRSTAAPCCRQTTWRSASTTTRTCCRCRRRFSSATCRRPRESAGWP